MEGSQWHYWAVVWAGKENWSSLSRKRAGKLSCVCFCCTFDSHIVSFFHSWGCLTFIYFWKINCTACSFSTTPCITVPLSCTFLPGSSPVKPHWNLQKHTLYSHFAGRPYPQLILASPVSQPWREAHSFFSIGPAARWIAPSTGEKKRTGDSEKLQTYVNPVQSDY